MPTVRDAKVRTGAYVLTQAEKAIKENVTGQTALNIAKAMKARVNDFDNAHPLIGLVGSKGAGKSTVAEILRRVYGYTEVAFALELKREMFNAFGADLIRPMSHWHTFQDWLEFIEEHKNDAPDTEFGWLRPMMQFWGTEYRRTLCGDDYWIDQVTPRLRPGVVVSDVRFANEVAAVRKAGGIIWAVIRSADSRMPDPHSSEQWQDTVVPDFWCTNLRDKDYLENVKIPQMMRLADRTEFHG